jgi:hypothetical protein
MSGAPFRRWAKVTGKQRRNCAARALNPTKGFVAAPGNFVRLPDAKCNIPIGSRRDCYEAVMIDHNRTISVRSGEQSSPCAV